MPLVGNEPVESYPLDTNQDSWGTLILVGDGASPEVFHVIAGLGDIDGPSQSRNVIERRTHSSASAYMGKSSGVINAGEISFPVAYVANNPSHSDTSTFGLGYLFINGTRRNMQIASSKRADGTRNIRQFVGWVSEFGESHPVEGRDERDTTIQIDGPITTIVP
jgi:hypothetical protein